MSFEESDSDDPLVDFCTDFALGDANAKIFAIKTLPKVALELSRRQIINNLIPFLEDIVKKDDCEEEILLYLSGQLIPILPHVGGEENGYVLFTILKKLAISDDHFIRERAVETLKKIGVAFDEGRIKEYLLPLMYNLIELELVPAQCSALELFPIAYPKLSEVTKIDLRRIYQHFCKDPSPVVRQKCVANLIQFMNVMEIEHVKEEFIPVFDSLAKDEEDEVRKLSINVGITIASKVKSDVIKEYILKTLLSMGRHASWVIRHQFASNIINMQIVFGPNVTRRKLMSVYLNLLQDEESQVKEISVSKLVPFCIELQNTYKFKKTNFEILSPSIVEKFSPLIEQQTYRPTNNNTETLEPLIIARILPVISELCCDPEEEVKEELRSIYTTFAKLLGRDYSKKYILTLILQNMNKEKEALKESIENLNSFISTIGVDNKLVDTVRNIIIELLTKRRIDWRAKRALAVTLMHITKYVTQEYFEKHLKAIYLHLLYDEIFAVRKTALLLLPLFAKGFGRKWMETFVREKIFPMAANECSSFRLLFLAGVEELIAPTLDTTGQKNTYLTTLKDFCTYGNETQKNNAAMILHLITTKFENMQVGFEQYDSFYRRESIDDIKIYTGETCDDFEQYGVSAITMVTENEIENVASNDSYLIGLVSFFPDVYTVVSKLVDDEVEKVGKKAVSTCGRIEQILKAIHNEVHETWAENAINTILRLRE